MWLQMHKGLASPSASTSMDSEVAIGYGSPSKFLIQSSGELVLKTEENWSFNSYVSLRLAVTKCLVV